MKQSNHQEKDINQLRASSCGNCWGHQEYEGCSTEKQVQKDSETADGFILKFVKRFL